LNKPPINRRYRRIVATLDRRQPDLTVVMENVHKTHNFGAIVRTGDAVGVGRVHAVSDDPDVVLGHKVASGTEKWVDVVVHRSISECYEYLRSKGFRIVVADVGEGAVDFRHIDYVQPAAIVVGSELDGLSSSARDGADLRIKIPLEGMVESLNVSVATGLILFEAQRQRQQAGLYDSRRIAEDECRGMLFEWLHPTVAEYCRRQNKPYPELDDNGALTTAIAGNERGSIAGFLAAH
jgi:tRNA (guanosine-2'-O-)-methyltransferase